MFSIFKDWLKDRGTKRGLLAYSVLIILVLATIFGALRELGAKVPPTYSISTIVVVLFLNLMHWVWYYSIYPLYLGKIKIAFSLKEESNDQLHEEIRKQFDNQLDTLGVKDKIRVIDLPGDKKFESASEAEQYCKKKDINLLIWGDTKRGELGGHKLAEFRLRFTYIYRKPPRKIEELLRSDVKSAVVDRNWRVATENSFKDIEIVSENLIEVSLFIIGLCLLLEADLKRCLEVFDRLDNCVQQARSRPHPGRDAFTKRFHKVFMEALDARGIILYYENKTEEWKKILERMLQIDSTVPGVHVNLAKLHYLDGDLETARFHTNQSEKLVPGHPWVLVNKAFFSIFDRRFDKAVKFYEELLKEFAQTESTCNTLEVAVFLEDEWKKNKQNLGFLFGAGFMNYYFADHRTGRAQLKKFLRRIGKDRKEYAPLFIVADNIMRHGTSV